MTAKAPPATHEEPIPEGPSHYSNAIDHDDIIGFEADVSTLPQGYYRSLSFWGSMLATALGLMAGTGAFAYAAPVLTQINEDIGPDGRYVWISLVYNTALAVCLAIVGRLSDIFGRRYFFIGGGVLSVVGSVICAKANSIPVLIGMAIRFTTLKPLGAEI